MLSLYYNQSLSPQPTNTMQTYNIQKCINTPNVPSKLKFLNRFTFARKKLIIVHPVEALILRIYWQISSTTSLPKLKIQIM